MRALTVLSLFTVVAAQLFAQAPSPATASSQPVTAHPANSAASPSTTPASAIPKFEAADVRFTAPYRVPFYSGAFLSGDRFIIRQATMAHLVSTAWNLNPHFVGDGPSWIAWDRYDIMAKVPPGTTLDTARIMLQDLLAERFKLVVHPGDVQVPAYLLTMANGKPTLKPSTAAEEGSCKPQYSGQPGSNIPPTWSLECRGASMAMLANSIGAMDSRDYVAYNTPVMDTTGLKGLYDFDLKWTPKFFLAQAGSGGVSLYQALEALGLDLELKFTPRPGIVIDSVIREPTANAPDLASIMPPLPSPQFDVATIKPSDPNVRRGDVRYGGNEINIQGIPLKTLIKIAWDLDPRNDDTLVAPKWLDSDKIDIHAKASQSEIGNNTMGRTNTVNPDALMPMLRDLLIDRFQIKYHMEERPIDAYALLADHPKLTPADPKEHTACGTALSDNGKDPSQTNIMLDSNQSCWNTTMDQFAGQLHRIAPDYFFYPVVDDTGIKGAWDFTLYWSSARLTQNGGPGTQAAPEGAPAALDPNGAISLFDAIRKQLGLKIEKQKHTEPVLVIDQISEKPTEN